MLFSASRQAVGISTEFLGEARIALRKVVTEHEGVLDEKEVRELIDVLQQLDRALDRR